VFLRRPPNRIAEIGTPLGSSYSSAMIGHCLMGAQNLELGCEDSSPLAGVQSRPFQPLRRSGGVPWPSHPASPASGSATLGHSELPCSSVRIALGLVVQSVPGATPNKPFSGLAA